MPLKGHNRQHSVPVRGTIGNMYAVEKDPSKGTTGNRTPTKALVASFINSRKRWTGTAGKNYAALMGTTGKSETDVKGTIGKPITCKSLDNGGIIHQQQETAGKHKLP